MAFVSYASLLALKTEGGAALLEKDLRALILGALLLFLGRERERGMACARTCARGEGGVQGEVTPAHPLRVASCRQLQRRRGRVRPRTDLTPLLLVEAEVGTPLSLRSEAA